MGEFVERILAGALEVGIVLIAAVAVVTYLRSVCLLRLWLDMVWEMKGEIDIQRDWFKLMANSPGVEVDGVFPTIEIGTLALFVPVLYGVLSSEPGIQLWDNDESIHEFMFSWAVGVYIGSWFLNKTVVTWRDLPGNALHHALWGLVFCGLSYVPFVNIPMDSWLPTVVRLSEPLAGSGFWNHFLYGLAAWAFVGLMLTFTTSLIRLIMGDWKYSGAYCATLIVVGYFVWAGGVSASLYVVVVGWLLCNLPILAALKTRMER